MKMKKILAATLAAAAALTMGMTASASETASFTTVKEGVLKVATNPYLAPYEFYYIDDDAVPHIAGLDITLAQRIADDLGLTLEIIPMDFDGILMELQYGTIDLGISALTPSRERAMIFDFTDLYYVSNQALCVREEEKDLYKDYDDFSGHTIGVISGSIQYGLAKEYCPDARIMTLPSFADVIHALVDGTIDAAITEKVVAIQNMHNHPEITVLWEVPYDAGGSAIALKKGNHGLRDAVNAVIAEAIADGSIDTYMADAMLLSEDTERVFEGSLEEYYEMAFGEEEEE